MWTLLKFRSLLSLVLAGVVGVAGLQTWPWPGDNAVLGLIGELRPGLYAGLRYAYTTLWFSTPFLGFAIAFSTLYIFVARWDRPTTRRPLPAYPDPELRNELFLVLGEQHRRTIAERSATPSWLLIPERGLYTGIAIIGAIGTGKTSACMYPYAEQLFAYRAGDPNRKVGGLILEVKGDFCQHVKRILESHGRGDDYVEVSLESIYRYNPLHNDLDAYALAYGIATLMTNLFGRSQEPFWQQASTNLVKFVILLHQTLDDYVTLVQVYEDVINPDKLSAAIADGERRFAMKYRRVVIDKAVHSATDGLGSWTWHTDESANDPQSDLTLNGAGQVSGSQSREPDSVADQTGASQRSSASIGQPRASQTWTPWCPEVEAFLTSANVTFHTVDVPPTKSEVHRLAQFQAVKRWFTDDWMRIEPKLRTSIVEGISVFLSLFDDNPRVKHTFCPPKELYDLPTPSTPVMPTASTTAAEPSPPITPRAPAITAESTASAAPMTPPAFVTSAAPVTFAGPATGADGIALPPIADLIEQGKVVALNFPAAMNPGLARALGTMLKQDFQRAVLNRVQKMTADPSRPWRSIAFICDEYQAFATTGENEPSGDDKFFSLARQARCIPIVATQSVSSLRSTLPGESWRALLQGLRTKIFLALSDDFSARMAADLCGKAERLKSGYTLMEAGQDAKVSLLTGRPAAHKTTVSATKTYNLAMEYVFQPKVFAELQNAQAIVLPYDGLNPLPPTFCYLKPYYLNVQTSYFDHVANGVL